MARTVRDTNLETRTARARLAVRHKPYWRVLETGLHLGYRRRASGGGSWIGRRFLGAKQYEEIKIGLADDFQDADGRTVLAFKHAQECVRAWWRGQQHKDLGLVVETGPYTVLRALEDYFDARERRGSKGLKSDRSVAAARIIPALGSIEVKKLTPRRIRDWHTDLATSAKFVRSKRGAAQATKAVAREDQDAIRARRSSANRVLTILKAALNHAFHEGHVGSDEAWRKVRPFREVDAPVIRFLSQAECVRVVNATQGAFRDLVRAALLTGCRYGELTRMRCGDFNAEAGTITVRESKAGKPRHVALNDEGQQLFDQLTRGAMAGRFIFHYADDRPWRASQQQRPLEEACRRAAIEPAVTFHILRHTYASALAMRGVAMGVIAAQLGHADTRMTERHYAHLAPSYVAEAVRAALPSIGVVDEDNVLPIRAA